MSDGLRRIALLGGTFDPPHCGHQALACGVADRLGLDCVMLVPTGNPHFKQDVKVTPVADRVAMARLLADEDPRLELCTIESDRPGVTYTVDTLKELRVLHPEAELLFIIGGDCLEHIWRWRSAEELASLCTVVAVVRRGYDMAAACAALTQSGVDFHVECLDFDVPDVSSTEVRRLAADGASLDGLVPASVERYIAEHGLYKAE